MTTILGPVPCQGCRRPVIWADCEDSWVPGFTWRNIDLWPHVCLARARERWDNTGVGISDATITDIMCDALLVADTSREGVPRLGGISS